MKISGGRVKVKSVLITSISALDSLVNSFQERRKKFRK